MSDLVDPPRRGPFSRSMRRGPGGPEPRGVEDGGDIFLAAVEAAPMPMVLSDPNQPDDPIVFANPAFLRMTGYARSEVVGRNCRFLQGPASAPDTVDLIRRTVRAKGEVAVELLNYRKDGTPFWNALFIAPVFDAAGRLVYFFASQLDVSRRREAEEELSRARAGASAPPVREVAHDLNNMLQVIAGQMEALAAHAAASGDARLIRRVGAASEAAERATALTRRLIDPLPDAALQADAEAAPDRAPRAAPAAAPGELAVPTPAVSEPPPRAADGRGERVLVVDDRAEIAELARTMLESAGYVVEVAGGGRDALEKLERGFALLFSDLVMPGELDGVGLAREAQRRDPRLKVLLTTGRAGPAAASSDGVGAGFETLAKPYRRSDLVRTVRRLLDASAPAA